MTTFPVLDDADDVLAAIRLGWGMAETRGRNRPDAPPGEAALLPANDDHALPLRVERTPTELRIEAQALVAGLAKQLHVDAAPDGTSFGATLDVKARLLYHARAPAALEQEQTASAGEAAGLHALEQAISPLTAQHPALAVQDATSVIDGQQPVIAGSAADLWSELAELIWEFDAHIQDTLAIASENQAIGYQLGRGLAETYWALDPQQPPGGATSWDFLLGSERCAELARLAGRLGAYMNEYTAPAIAGSIDVWKAVAADKEWRKGAANPALYDQIRRWYELIILGQDPTTLIQPGDLLKDYRVIGRTLKWFGPELGVLTIGVAALGALIVLLSTGASTTVTTISGALAAVGLTAAGVVGKLKNSEQATLTRLRQDAYTDLVAYAVQTAPVAANEKKLRTALAQRQLTAATPNQVPPAS